MKMRTTISILIFALVTITFCLQAQGVQTYNVKPKNTLSHQYYLPKKYLIIKVKYTLSKTVIIRQVKYSPAGSHEVYNKLGANGLYEKIVEPPQYSAAIKDPIVMTEVIVADSTPYFLEYSYLNKGGKSFKLGIAGDKGLIQAINGEQTPVAPEIIGGVLGFATKIISVAAEGIASGIWGAASAATSPANKEDEVLTTEQVIEVSQLIEFEKSTGTKTIKPTLIAGFIKIPSVIINWKEIDKRPQRVDTILKDDKKVPADTFPVEGFVFREPLPVKFSIDVKDNEFVDSARVFDNLFNIPQCGHLASSPLPIEKGKKTVGVTIDLSSGQITKYDFAKESGSSATFSKINSSTEELGKAVVELRKAQEDQKKDTSTQDKIDQLTLENSLRQQEILSIQKKKELEKEKTGSN
jgi:hypothetical protein